MIITELWGKKPTKLREDYSPINEEGVVIGDHIVVSGRVQGRGDTGQVVELGRGGNFVVVKMNDGAIRSFQTSDVKRMDNDEEDDDLLGDRHYSDWDDDLDERAGPVGGGRWQSQMEDDTVDVMAHDELEDDTDLMEDRLDERAGPVSVIRWGKPWLDAGSDGSKVSSTPDYTIDYTQENPNFQGSAHESDLETFYDYDDLGDFPGYDIPSTEDTQGLQKGGQCDLVNYKTAKPTLANTLAPDPEAPGSSGAEDDSDDTDDLLFGETEPEFVKDPYDLDYPNGNQTTKLSFPSVKQKKNSQPTEEGSDSETEVKHQKTLDRLEETVAKLSPTVILEHTDAEIKEACYSVADKHWGQRLNSSDIGILAHRVVHLLRNS